MWKWKEFFVKILWWNFGRKLPTNKTHLKLWKWVYKDYDYKLDPSQIDFERIWNNSKN